MTNKELKSGYQVRLETYSGEVMNISLANKNAVRLFIEELPNRLSKGTKVSFACDVLALGGSIMGRKQ